MENASKALIIAGAILLSILIIGLGMMIFNQAKDAIGNTGMDTQKANAYNAEFLSYLGDNISGANVRTLCDIVRSHNTTNVSESDDSLKVTITVDGQSGDTASTINAVKKKVQQGKTYKVEVNDDGYDSNTGYIKTITVTTNSK